MNTEEDLRTLRNSPTAAPAVSALAVRQRATSLRRGRRAGYAAAAAVATPVLALFAGTVTGVGPLSAGHTTTLQAGNGSGAGQAYDSSITLQVPGLHAWNSSGALCWGQPREIVNGFHACVTPAEVPAGTEPEWRVYGTTLGVVVNTGVVRAEFVDGARTIPAQVVAFPGNPAWQLVIADVGVTESSMAGLDYRAYNAAGSLVHGCATACPPTAEQPPTADSGSDAASRTAR